MSTTPEPFRYTDEDDFCLSARLLPDFDTGGVTDMLSITIEGSDEPQSVHVPVADLPQILAGLAGAAGKPKATNPAAAVEVRDRCPHCGDHQLVPRALMAEHLARLHPEEARRILAGDAASGVQPDTRPTVPCGAEALTVGWHYAHDWQPQPGMAPVRCPGTGAARSVPDTERRERYAAAIQRKVTAGIKLNSILPEVYDAADAAMAVADTEQRDQVAATKYWFDAADERREEIDRLQTRLQLVTAETVADVVGPNIDLLCKENARLRAELEQARATTLDSGAKRTETRQSYLDLAAQAREARDFEGEADVAQALRRREEQWAREDTAARSGGQAEDGAPVVTPRLSYRLEHRRPSDPVWQRNTPAIGANWSWQSRAKADQRLAEARDRWPDHEHRLVTITTTVIETAADEDGAQQK